MSRSKDGSPVAASPSCIREPRTTLGCQSCETEGWVEIRVLQQLVREPLIHFLLIGTVVFAAYGAGETNVERPESTVITVTDAQIDRLKEQFEVAWRRVPAEAELAALVEDLVREEVYYREALALGLDRDDTVIRRRLRQKMEFLGEGAGTTTAIDEAQLAAHHAAYPERFAVPAQITFRQVMLNETDAPEAARVALENGADPESVGRVGLLAESMVAAGEAAVDGVFGPGFFTRIAALPEGRWDGPVSSAYGQHLIEVVAFQAGREQPFEAVRAAVEQDWQRENALVVREAQYEILRQRYRVVLPEAAR